MARDDWRRFVAPAAFLLAVTVAVLLIRSGLQSGNSPSAKSPARVTTPRKTVSSTTTTGTTTRKTTTTPAGKQFWTVQAGDTFGVISTKSGVSLATIQQLNPTVKSTSLFIGQKIRLK
jgi:LysM repeat protein